MLSIKQASDKDISTIRHIALATWPQTYIPIIGGAQVAYMLSRFYSPEALKQQLEDGHTFIIAFSGEKAVAFASYGFMLPGIFKLHKLYILPECQGMGTGSALLEYIKNAIVASGAKELRLNVNIHNSAAISFYKKTGFRHLHDEDIDIGAGYYMNDHILGLAI